MRNVKSSQWRWVVAGVLGISLLVMGFPFGMSRWEINQAGLDAMEVCLGKGTSSIAHVNFAYFQARMAACQGMDNEAVSAYGFVLSGAQPRTRIVRAVQPYNVELAALASRMHPEDAQAHFWLGEAYKSAGDVPKAILTYEMGLQIDPANGEEWDNLGRLYEMEDSLEQAVGAYDQACYFVDQGKNGCPNAARLYMEQKMYEQAVIRYEDTLSQLPGYVPALKGIAEALLFLGRLQEAIPYLEMLVMQGDAEAQTVLEQLHETP